MRPSLFIGLALAVRLSAGVEGVGSTSANFLKIGSGSRATAMGEAYTALADDASGLGYNPAGMLSMNQSEIQATHTSWFGGVNFEQVSLISAINMGQAMGFSFGYVGLPSQPVSQATGSNSSDPLQNFRDIGSTSPFDMRGSVAYSRLWGSQWKLGGLLNVTGQGIAGHTAMGLGLDLGVLKEIPIDGMQFGLAVQNIGFAVPLLKESFGFPLTFRGGLSYQVNEALVFSMDAGMPIDNAFFGGIGMEANLDQLVYVRAGYRYDNIFNPFSAGIGFALGQTLLDLVWVPAGDLGQTYRGTLSWRWGGWVTDEKDVDLKVLSGLKTPFAPEAPPLSVQPLVREPRLVKDWALFVYGGNPSAVVRQYKGLGAFGESVEWDGKTDQGAQAPDGTYQAVLSVRLRNGKVVYSPYRKLEVNPPAPEISLGVQGSSLMPGQEGTLFVPSVFKVATDKPSQLPLRWRLEMVDASGAVFQTVEGLLSEAPEYKWEGVNEKGESFISNSVYQFRLSLVDASGKVVKRAQPLQKLCVFRQ